MNAGCPICNSKRHSIIYESLPQCPDAEIVQCSSCLHIYTLLKKTIEIENLYNDEVYKVVDNRDSIFDRILNWEYGRVVKKINLLKPGKGNLLDFGAGKGKFGSLAKKNGWNVKCVETSAERAAYAKTVYQLEVNTDFYSHGKIFNLDFDVLTLFHVLEHLPQPQALLEELVKSNLTTGGLLVIEIPNINSLQARLSKSSWIHLDVPRHINHFTPNRIKRLVEDIGLTTVKTTFFSFHLGVLGMVDSILKLLGYKKNIIYELKNKKNPLLLLYIIFLLPIALLLEIAASYTGRGGIIRMYSKKIR